MPETALVFVDLPVSILAWIEVEVERRGVTRDQVVEEALRAMKDRPAPRPQNDQAMQKGVRAQARGTA